MDEVNDFVIFLLEHMIWTTFWSNRTTFKPLGDEYQHRVYSKKKENN
jgi:hypothetical protein